MHTDEGVANAALGLKVRIVDALVANLKVRHNVAVECGWDCELSATRSCSDPEAD